MYIYTCMEGVVLVRAPAGLKADPRLLAAPMIHDPPLAPAGTLGSNYITGRCLNKGIW